jgi:hypothetical protein
VGWVFAWLQADSNAAAGYISHCVRCTVVDWLIASGALRNGSSKCRVHSHMKSMRTWFTCTGTVMAGQMQLWTSTGEDIRCAEHQTGLFLAYYAWPLYSSIKVALLLVRSGARGPGELQGLPLPARCVGCRLTARYACAYHYHSNRTYPRCFLLHLCAVSWLHTIIMVVTRCTLRVARGVLKLKKAQHVTSIICFPLLWAACLKLLVFFFYLSTRRG